MGAWYSTIVGRPRGGRGEAVQVNSLLSTMSPRTQEGVRPFFSRPRLEIACQPRLFQILAMTSTTAAETSQLQPHVSIVTDPIVALFSPPTRTFSGLITVNPQPLLTGRCADPYFVLVSDDAKASTSLTPWLGCSEARPDCCPFDIFAAVAPVLRACPVDYVMSQGICCPS